MENKVSINTAYQITVYSNKGRIKFTATRRYCSATYNGHTEYGFLGWEVFTYKIENREWKRVKFEGYPSKIGNKKLVIDFLATSPIFSKAINELKNNSKK